MILSKYVHLAYRHSLTGIVMAILFAMYFNVLKFQSLMIKYKKIMIKYKKTHNFTIVLNKFI